MTYDCLSNHEEPKTKLANTSYDFYSNFVPLNFILRKQITNLLLKEGYKHSFRRIRKTNGISLFNHSSFKFMKNSYLKWH